MYFKTKEKKRTKIENNEASNVWKVESFYVRTEIENVMLKTGISHLKIEITIIIYGMII